MNDPPLKGRRAIVTGAARGLGKSFAEAIAAAGGTVSACDVEAEVTELEQTLRRHDALGVVCRADVSDAESVHEFVEASARRMGGVDLLVNNAAIVRKTSPISDSFGEAIRDFEAVVGVNYRGPFLCGRAAIPHLVKGGGDIVNITSDHIHTCGYPVEVDHSDAPNCSWARVRRPPVGNENFDLYDSSKWALKGLTNVWARALFQDLVRVNCFGMGTTDTPMIRAHLAAKGADPPPGILDPLEVADVLVALVAEGVDGRTGDSVEVWPDHPCVLPPVGLDGRLAMAAMPSRS